MNYFLDITLAAIVIAAVLVCWHRGLIRSIVGVIKVVLAAILTYILGPIVAEWVQGQWSDPKVTNFVYERLLAVFEEGAQRFDLSSVFDQMPQWLKVTLTNFNVDLNALSDQYASMTDGSSTELYHMAVSIASPISEILSNVIGYVSVFILATVILTILAWCLSKVADLPVIRTCDRLLGFILGVICAIFYSSVYVVLIYTLLNWLEVSHTANIPFRESFEATFLFRYAYDWNIFRILFGL